MAIYDKAVQKPIPLGSNDPVIDAVGIILHVAVSNADSLFDYFNGPSDGIESHFYINNDGIVEQYRDTDREADANLEANSFVKHGETFGFISVETAGMEHGQWNSKQLAAIKGLLVWASQEHGFPLRVCPGPFESGVGYHVLFGAPGPWTPIAKSCPGPDRINQFNEVLVPWMAEDHDEEDEVKQSDINAIADAILKSPVVRNKSVKDPNADGAWWTIPKALSEIESRTQDIKAEIQDLQHG